MNEAIVSILDFNGEGYKPLVNFGTWRVAFLRFIDELIPENIQKLERHIETDEVFVLLKGEAILFFANGEKEVNNLQSLQLEPGRLFNVRKNTWHCCVLSKDATILLVENNDTGKDNTEYEELKASQKEFLVITARNQIQDWKK